MTSISSAQPLSIAVDKAQINTTEYNKSNHSHVPTIFETAINYLKETSGVKNLVKAISYGAFWVRHFIPSAPEYVDTISREGSFVKNAIGISEVPEKFSKLIENGKKFWCEPSWSNGSKIFSDSCSLTNTVADSLSASKRFIPIPQNVIQGVNSVNACATLLGSTKATVDEVVKISENKIQTATTEQEYTDERNKLTLYLLNLARNISYVAVGVLGVCFYIGGIAIAPWAFLAGATSGLVFTIGGYFFDKIVDPEKKYHRKGQGLSLPGQVTS